MKSGVIGRKRLKRRGIPTQVPRTSELAKQTVRACNCCWQLFPGPDLDPDYEFCPGCLKACVTDAATDVPDLIWPWNRLPTVVTQGAT